MSYLSERLRAVMERQGCTQGSLAAASGVPIAVISRTLNDQSEIGDANYNALVQSLTLDPDEQAELMAARLRDWCVGPGADRVTIRIDAPLAADSPVATSLLLRSLGYLDALGHRNTEVRELVIDLARCLGYAGQPAEEVAEIVDQAVRSTGGYGRAKRGAGRRRGAAGAAQPNAGTEADGERH